MGPERCGIQRGVKTGDGLKNTKIPASKGFQYEAASAVYDKDLYGNRYTDWFIPDRKELNLLYESIKSGKLNPELFRAKYYWRVPKTVTARHGKGVFLAAIPAVNHVPH